MIDWNKLGEPFTADEIEWRLQQAGERNGKVWAIVVPYVTNRAIMDRLDNTVGPENWRNEFRPGPGGGVICGISIRIGEEWVTKWDGAENTDIEAVKGGLSGAMKRAAVLWKIGRYLYALEESFAQVSENGRERGKTKDGKPFRWDPPKLPEWALPQAAERQEGDESESAAEAEIRYHLKRISELASDIPKDATVELYGSAENLRKVIRSRWEDMKVDLALTRRVADAVASAIPEDREAA